MNGQEFYNIFKNYKDVTLNRNGFSVSFDSPKHAMEAFKDLVDVLKTMDKNQTEEKAKE